MAFLITISARVARLTHRICWSLALISSALTLSAPAAETFSRSLDVQAVFLVNLTRFVRWPAASFPQPDSPFILGITANDPIAPVLQEAIQGEASGSHPLVVRMIKSPADAAECHLVYFSQTVSASAPQIIATLRDKPVLTVSDASGFLRLGGQVQFYTRSGQVKLRINLPAMQRVNLTPSTPLLRVADIVRP